MKFILKGPFKENIYSLMRKTGYLFLDKNEATGEMSFVNPIGVAGKEGYPRFHIFLTVKDNDLIFDLHLDQKKPSYPGSTPHGGEYSGPVVKAEAKRIKQILENLKK